MKKIVRLYFDDTPVGTAELDEETKTITGVVINADLWKVIFDKIEEVHHVGFYAAGFLKKEVSNDGPPGRKGDNGSESPDSSDLGG